jgi:hypothetical protein
MVGSACVNVFSGRPCQEHPSGLRRFARCAAISVPKQFSFFDSFNVEVRFILGF